MINGESGYGDSCYDDDDDDEELSEPAVKEGLLAESLLMSLVSSLFLTMLLPDTDLVNEIEKNQRLAISILEDILGDDTRYDEDFLTTYIAGRTIRAQWAQERVKEVALMKAEKRARELRENEGKEKDAI